MTTVPADSPTVDDERPARRLSPRWDLGIGVMAFAVSVFAVYQVFRPLSGGSQFFLVLFLGFTLPLVMLCYRAGRVGPPGAGGPDDPTPVDWALAGVSALVGLYPVLSLSGGYDAFLNRQGTLSTLDVIMGSVLLLVILEAVRRTTGWALPAVCLGFLAYSYYGGYLPVQWTVAHSGIDFPQIINALYNDASGFYGTPLDVAAGYVVLFTVYGAVLESSGAGRFFVDLGFSLFRRSATAPGRTTVVAGFLLGSVSGSGAATTVGLGGVAWPVLRRSGYPAENAGGLLAAAGIGAILSPPTLGTAAFIIAEYLRVSYAQVMLWACVPTVLYYLGVFLVVSADARRHAATPVDVGADRPWTVLRRGGHHLLSLLIVVGFLAAGMPPFTAVVYATALAALFGLLRDGVDRWRRWAVTTARAVATGVRGALPIIAVCAAAGVITSTITKTGLGQALSSSLVNTADRLAPTATVALLLTALFAAVAVNALGLAVPVTASFIIAWVVLGPALTGVGVGVPEAAMFLFYYAVLSEVTPPTALAAVAAAGITGGRVLPTMWQTTKYTLPAFLVPVSIVLTDAGSALLLRGPLTTVLWAPAAAAGAVVALSAVTTGWFRGPVSRGRRVLFAVATGFLLYLTPVSAVIGGVVLLCAALPPRWVGRTGAARRVRQERDGQGRDCRDRREQTHA